MNEADPTESIDYNLKIKNFMAMTETGDPEIATQYLSSVNWDETAAVNNFFNKIKNNTNQNNLNVDGPINIPNINNHANNNKNNNSSQNQNQNQNQGGFLSSIFNSITNLFNSCYTRREVDIEEENKIFKFLPNKINDYETFNKLIKKNIGILIFYSAEKVDFIKKFIGQVCRNTNLVNLLKNNFIIYPLLSSTDEACKIENMITDKNLIYPSFIFCFNKTNSNILNKNNVLNILESETITLDIFYSTLIDSLEKMSGNKGRGIRNSDNKYNILSDGEILEKQKNDMEVLEQLERQKEEKILQEKIKEKKILDEIEKRADEAKKKVLDEPDINDPNCTTICFRYPDGEQRKDRRFLKSNTIQNLYDYVASLGKEIYTEEDNNSFSLYQPFPPKKYDIMENTLEKEGLFPNAIIQIKEEE